MARSSGFGDCHLKAEAEPGITPAAQPAYLNDLSLTTDGDQNMSLVRSDVRS